MLAKPILQNLRMALASSGILANPSENFEVAAKPSLEKLEIHVLAVDDNSVDRKVIERLLKIFSCKVTVVESGKRALQFLGLDEEKSSAGSSTTGLNVHLIITDYSMPEMTGYDLLKKIKESSTFREVPVVIMSSENILTRIDRCLEGGAKEYIIKPVKFSDVKRIKELIMRSNGVNEVMENDSKNPGPQNNDLPSPTSFLPSSTSSQCVINPVLLGFPCPSTKCNCRSWHLRFCSRSLNYPSLSLN